jgi:uncharacterized protein YndB with AHSA1/START domain
VTESPPVAVIVERVLPGPPEVVYDEWLDPEGMLEWMCPRPARPIGIRLDPTVGGRFVIDVEDEGVELTISGHYRELDRPRRLRFTWNCTTWDRPDPGSEVTVTLEARPEGRTLMTIHHRQLPPEVVDGHRHGWALIASQLERRLAVRS